MDLNKVLAIIDGLQNQLANLREEVTRNPHVNIRVNGPVSVSVRQDQRIPSILDHMMDSSWPEAVPSDLLADIDNPDDLEAYSEMVIDTIDHYLKDTRFLDYGCGHGYMARQASLRNTAISVGFDLNRSHWWDKIDLRSNLKYTDKPFELEKSSFDVVLLFDVLDHAEEPVELLKHIQSLLSPTGVVYIHCHPWTSRTGGHLYRKFNKAYAHLFLEDHQYDQLQLPRSDTQRIMNPVPKYRQWFEESGFEIVKETTNTENLETIFRVDPIWTPLYKLFSDARRYDTSIDEKRVVQILELQSLDFVVRSTEIL